MYQSLIVYPVSRVRDGGKRRHGRKVAPAKGWRRVAALAWCAASSCAFAVGASVGVSEGRNPLVQTSLGERSGWLVLSPGDGLVLIEPPSGIPREPFFAVSEATQCREKPYRFCSDLSKSEFRLTSLRFMVPEVPGLKTKSLTIRRNSVVVNYTFR